MKPETKDREAVRFSLGVGHTEEELNRVSRLLKQSVEALRNANVSAAAKDWATLSDQR